MSFVDVLLTIFEIAMVGFVMKNSRGKADANLAEEKIKEIIG